MKKIYLPLLGLGLFASSAYAQTPVKESKSLIHKITATWCGPCGMWGWSLANELITANEDKALYMSVFSSTNGANDNSKFYNTTASTLAQQFTLIGYPDFGVNGFTATEQNYTPGEGINTVGIKSDINDSVNAFAGVDPIASAASFISVNGNTVTVTAKAKFWSASSGDYYLAAYLLEDGAMNLQNGQGSAPVAHHSVLRASMTAASAWGESIATGNITANQTASKTFTFTVTNTEWDKTKFEVYNVLWKKEGNFYKFVNVSKASKNTVSVSEIINTSKISLYPNPANDILNVEFDVVNSSDITYNIINILGQQMGISLNTSIKKGTNYQSINTSTLAPGIYILNIITDRGTVQKKFTKK